MHWLVVLEVSKTNAPCQWSAWLAYRGGSNVECITCRGLEAFPWRLHIFITFDIICDFALDQVVLNQQREQVALILRHSTAYIIKVVVCWQYSQPDATYHAVKKAGQKICSKIVIFSIGCAVFWQRTHRWVFCLTLQNRTGRRCFWPQWPCHGEANGLAKFRCVDISYNLVCWNALQYWCWLSQMNQPLIKF